MLTPQIHKSLSKTLSTLPSIYLIRLKANHIFTRWCGKCLYNIKFIYETLIEILSAIKVWEDQTSLKFRETTEKHAQE